MYAAYKLNKQDDSIQPWHTPFPIWNQSVVPCPVLTVASWPAYRFFKRQVTWSGIPISFRNFHKFIVIHTVKGFGIVNKADIDVFLEVSCFFHDPADVGNLISGLGRFPGEGNGNPLQYSCLGKLMDRGAWRATIHTVTQSWTWLRLFSPHTACGILVPWPGIKPGPSAVKVQSSSHWTTKEFPMVLF